MHLIPVIDLRGGQVVHARRGDRRAYRPLRSRLCTGSDPPQVLAALLALFPFDTLYVADLDAIEGRGDNAAALQALHRARPDLDLWVDAGVADHAALTAFRARHRATPVLGSESLREHALLGAGAAVVLSLDYRDDRLLGAAALETQPERWPARTLIMDLRRVGSDLGPGWARLAALSGRRAPHTRLYAAGGVRHGADLARLAALGIHGALIASALHSGALSARELRAAVRLRPAGTGRAAS